MKRLQDKDIMINFKVQTNQLYVIPYLSVSTRLFSFSIQQLFAGAGSNILLWFVCKLSKSPGIFYAPAGAHSFTIKSLQK